MKCPVCRDNEIENYVPCQSCIHGKKGVVSDSIAYATVKPGKIGFKKGRRKGVWQQTPVRGKKTHVFFTCFKCAAIQTVHVRNIDANGFVTRGRGVICKACKTHQWTQIGKWAPKILEKANA